MADAFTRPTFKRCLTLMAAAVLNTGRRTVANLLRTAGGLAKGHPSSYHSVFSRRRWSAWTLARALASIVLRRFAPNEPVPLAGDDTVAERRGVKVYGKGRHRDPVRSTHGYTAWRWGHKWVVLTALVKFSFAPRPWALPLTGGPVSDPRVGPRARPPAQDALRADAPAACRPDPLVPRPAVRLRRRRRLRHARPGAVRPPASPPAGPGQPVLPGHTALRARPGGRRQAAGPPAPQERGEAADPPRGRRHGAPEVSWYGGGRRDIEVVSGAGHWLKSGKGLVPVCWAFVHDKTGTHRDEYFFSTDPGAAPQSIVEGFTGRWSIETIYQEMRPFLGLETTRGWTEATVLRGCHAPSGCTRSSPWCTSG